MPPLASLPLAGDMRLEPGVSVTVLPGTPPSRMTNSFLTSQVSPSFGDHAAHAIGRPAIAVDHEIAAILQRDRLGRIAPDVEPFRRRPGEAVIVGDDHHHVLGVAAGIDMGAQEADEAAVLEAQQRRLLVVDDAGRDRRRASNNIPNCRRRRRSASAPSAWTRPRPPPRSRGCGRRAPSEASRWASASSRAGSRHASAAAH